MSGAREGELDWIGRTKRQAKQGERNTGVGTIFKKQDPMLCCRKGRDQHVIDVSGQGKEL